MNRRQFLLGGLGAAAVAPFGLASYACLVEPHWVEVVRRRMAIRHLPAPLRGRTLVQLSDLHVGPRVDDDYLRGVFRRVAAMAPDYVVITGDVISYRGPSQIEQLRTMSASFPRGTSATVAVLGNHEYGFGWSNADVARQVADVLEEAGLTVLRNRAADVDGLTVVGMDDLWAQAFDPARALKGLRPDAPAIVLCHNPDALDHAGWGGYRGWVLAGHTHGGQCRLPFLPPPQLPVRNPRYAAGEVRLADGRRLYVNRGIGHLTKVRFNVRPEITVFTLDAA